ncbi:AfsR/SARP family transcriptional regulator [Deinococcus aerophilus]|uniref:Transcriptional activator n=1 Tax=Deinococcus aerophilus TaxID=522488 RepID=A0ABQ2GV87_9DEIO|nr:NB-ARC domain-containing protein [Deinococcus aerophilus]GGM13248.1 transcriptional activator [Deinococcus aerophilus]
MTVAWSFAVLGPPRLLRYGADVNLRSHKAIALLAILALDGPTPRETLASILWERDRHHARQSLRAVLSTLTQLLGDPPLLYAGRTILHPDLGAMSLDAHQLGTEDPDTFLSLWRGPFLSGVTIRDSPSWDDWQSRWEMHLTHSYLDRALALAGAALRNGRPADAAHLTERLLELDPFSAEGARLLLLAHEHAGHTAAARLFHEAFTHRYRAEYGEFPNLILQQQPLPVTASSPAPPAPTSFVGRRAERVRLLHLLRSPGCHLITLHGPGGIGKTRLALQVIQDLQTEPGGGEFHKVLFVALEHCAHASEVPACLAAAFGVPLANERDALQTLSQFLREGRTLVILDNYDDLLAFTPLLMQLARSCAGVTFLVTSRERLRVRDEHVIMVGGMDVPAPTALHEDFDRADVVRLFRSRASQVSPLVLTADTRPLIRRICLAVGGSPLGVELSAAWTGVLPLEALADELERDALHLDFPMVDLPGRHRSLARALEASWQRLNPEQQQVLARLTVFRGGFRWEAARVVAGATLNTLEELTAKALITLLPGGRSSFHPLVRAFAISKLAPDDAREWAVRHATHFRERLTLLNHEAGGAASPALVTLLREEEANIRAALQWLISQGAYADLALMAEPVLWSYPLMGRFQDGLAFCETLLPKLQEPPARQARASFMIGYAWLTLFTNDVPRALALGQEVLSVVADQEDPLLRLRALDGYGQACVRALMLTEGREVLRQAETIARELGDPTRLMRTLNNLGLASALLEAFDEARRCNGEAYALYTGGHVPPGMDVIWLLSSISVEWMLQNDLLASRTVLLEALGMIEALGVQGQEPIVSSVLGLVELELALQQREQPNLEVLKARVEQTLASSVISGELFARTLSRGVHGRLSLLDGLRRDGAVAVLTSLSEAWETRNLVVFTWLLPYGVLALKVAGDEVGAAALAAFMAQPASGSVWERSRSERESQMAWSGSPKSAQGSVRIGSASEAARRIQAVLTSLPTDEDQATH